MSNATLGNPLAAAAATSRMDKKRCRENNEESISTKRVHNYDGDDKSSNTMHSPFRRGSIRLKISTHPTAHVAQETALESQVLSADTVAAMTNLYGDTISDTYSTVSRASQNLVVRDIIVRCGEFRPVVGLDSPIWVNYSDVQNDPCIEAFIASVTHRQWKQFIDGRQIQEISSGSLDIEEINEELSIVEVLEMKACNDRWMFLVKTSVETNLDGIVAMELSDALADFCSKKDWSN